MQYKIRTLLIVSVALILSSCGSKVKITPLPAEVAEKTLLREFDVENIAQMRGVSAIDSLLILSFDRADSIFCVYNTNTGEEVLKFGALGRQKDEFLLPEQLEDYKHTLDNFVVYDFNTDCFKRINLGKVISSGKTQDNVLITECAPVPNMGSRSSSPDFKTMIGESCYGAHIDATAHIMVYQDGNNKNITSPFYKMFSFPNEYSAKISDDYFFAVDYDKQIIAAAYLYYDGVLFYDFEGNLLNTLCISEWKQLNFTRRDDRINISDEENIYCSEVRSTEKYIYVSRINISSDEYEEALKENEIKTDILKINWEGNIVDLYRFDTHILKFVVGDEDDRITTLSLLPNDTENIRVGIYEI